MAKIRVTIRMATLVKNLPADLKFSVGIVGTAPRYTTSTLAELMVPHWNESFILESPDVKSAVVIEALSGSDVIATIEKSTGLGFLKLAHPSVALSTPDKTFRVSLSLATMVVPPETPVGPEFAALPPIPPPLVPTVHEHVSNFTQALQDMERVGAIDLAYHQPAPDAILRRVVFMAFCLWENTERRVGDTAINDLLAMAQIYRAHGYEVFFTRDPNRRRFVGWLNRFLTHTDDELVVVYHGHGVQVEDKDGDEEDGKDEALCLQAAPGSMEEELFLDDHLTGLLRERKRRGCRLFVLTMCCHSGTMVEISPDDGSDGIVFMSSASDSQSAFTDGASPPHTPTFNALIRFLRQHPEGTFAQAHPVVVAMTTFCSDTPHQGSLVSSPGSLVDSPILRPLAEVPPCPVPLEPLADPMAFIGPEEEALFESIGI